MREKAMERHLTRCLGQRGRFMSVDETQRLVSTLVSSKPNFCPVCGESLSLTVATPNRTVLSFAHPLGSVFDGCKMEIVIARYELRAEERYDVVLYMCSQFGSVMLDVLKDVNLPTVDEIVKYWSYKLQNRGWRADWR